MNYVLTWIPRGINAPRACDLRRTVLHAINARHAAIRARTFERRSGATVLTVLEEKAK